MYHYKEECKVNGKTLRMGGITKRSLAAMKHIPKVGTIQSVKGYTYNGRGGNTHTGVLVKGDKGSVRFGGFSWGYCGEGCRGLQILFDSLHLPADATMFIVWPSLAGPARTHWKFNLIKGIWYTDNNI